MTLLEENIGRKLLDMGLGNDFLEIRSKSTSNKIKNKVDLRIKLKSFCIAKETNNKVKRQPTKQEKVSANHLSNKG